MDGRAPSKAVRDRAMAAGDSKQAMFGSHAGKTPEVPPHVRTMMQNIDDRARAERLSKAQKVVDETAAKVKQLEAQIRTEAAATRAGQDSSPTEFARATAAVAAARRRTGPRPSGGNRCEALTSRT